MATVELMVKCRKIWEYEEIQDIMLIDCTKQLIYEQPIFCGFLIFLVTNYCNNILCLFRYVVQDVYISSMSLPQVT